MHKMLAIVILILCIPHLHCVSSNSEQEYTLGPDDFALPLQNLLYAIEQNNEVALVYSGCRGNGSRQSTAEMHFDELNKLATVHDLERMTRCSNPTLRAFGFVVLLAGKDVDCTDLLLEHVADSALVTDDYDQQRHTVISLALMTTNKWSRYENRLAVERKLLLERPTERASYCVADIDRQTDTFPGFYQAIRTMSEALLDYEFSKRIGWHNGMCAVERLASYGYAADTSLLQKLFRARRKYGDGSFAIDVALRLFPSKAFEPYYLRTDSYWKSMFNFQRRSYYQTAPFIETDGIEHYVKLLALHRSETSARLLEMAFDESPFDRNPIYWDVEPENAHDELKKLIATEIRTYTSSYYSPLLDKTKAWVPKDLVIEPSNEHFRMTINQRKTVPAKAEKPFMATWWE